MSTLDQPADQFVDQPTDVLAGLQAVEPAGTPNMVRCYSLPEVAALTSTSVDFWQRAILTGEIGYIRLGREKGPDGKPSRRGLTRIPHPVLERFIADRLTS